MAYVNNGAYDRWLLQQQREAALNNYNANKEALDAKYGNNSGLAAFLGGIGKGISDVWNGTIDMLGSGIASARDLGSMLTTGKTAGENDKWLMHRHNTDNLQDAYSKAAGQALNAATTLGTSVLPGAAAGSTVGKALGGVAGNTLGGAIGGVADEFQYQGKDADLGQAAKRAAAGAAAGLTTGGLNRMIGNSGTRLGQLALNNKLAQSTLGRGALSGAVGGATGAGVSAALDGQDVGNAALQGALTGAMSGATQAGLSSAAKNLYGAVREDASDWVANRRAQRNAKSAANVMADTPVTEVATTTTAVEGMPDYTKPKDWNGNELKIEKKGKLGQYGDRLERTATAIENQDIYNTLPSKLSNKITRNKSIERLKDLGFGPENYSEAAKVSTAVNKFFDDVVGNSGATISDPELADRVKQLPKGAVLNDPLQKEYNAQIGDLMTNLEKGAAPGVYSGADLLKASREFSNMAATQYRRGTDAYGADLGNYRNDLGDAYMKVSRDLRTLADRSMDGLGDKYTKSQLTKMLQNMGANKKTIDYVTNYKDLPEGIRKTALLEDARSMDEAMRNAPVRRNAIAGDSGRNIVNTALNKSGIPQVAGTLLEPVGKVSGGIVKRVGKGLQALDRGINSMQTNNAAGTTTQAPTFQYTPLTTNQQIGLGDFIGRMQGQIAGGNKLDETRSQLEYQNLEDTKNAIDEIDAQIMNLQQVQQQPSQAEQNLAEISNAMNNALAAGDISAYNQLASLYKNAYDMYKLQGGGATTGTGSTTTANLSSTEKNNLAKLETAGNALDELETLFKKAGGGQGIAGNLSNLLGTLGMNSNVKTYNDLSQGLINQIAASIGKTDALNNEGEVKRALSLVPQITDDAQTAQNKLTELRRMLAVNKNSYNQLYGLNG